MKTDCKQYDVLIIGAGGAGLFCGAQAGQRGRRVALLDHSEKIGRKILISGGGRCNFTNINANPGSFVSQNPHFCKSALSRYRAADFISLVKQYRIPFHEKKLGQLFCDRSAQEIVDLLVSECEKGEADFFMGTKILSVEKSDGFLVRTTRGDFRSPTLVIATGGLSIPQIGATGFGYEIAKQFGLKVVSTAPALDGFVFREEDLGKFSRLSGVSIDSKVSCNGAQFRENILFTHTGLSGPASLQASLYWNSGDDVRIDLLPDCDPSGWLHGVKRQGSKLDLKNLLAQKLPKRFAELFCEFHVLNSKLFQYSDKKIADIAEKLSDWTIKPKCTVGYRKAEVTRGGVDTDCLSAKTMEAKSVEGLYFIGEVVDVTGQLGGYNFQWAWSSAHAAAQSV
jgi:predicted Rossmann fold flavoprotein